MEFMDIMKESSNHVKSVNEAMRNLEIVKEYMDIVNQSDVKVGISSKVDAALIDDFLPEDVVRSVMDTIVNATEERYQQRYEELFTLIGIVTTPSISRDVTSEDIHEAAEAIGTEIEKLIDETQQRDSCKDVNRKSQKLNPWEQEDILRMDYITQNKTVKVMAKEYGCTTGQVYTGLNKFGIRKKSKNDPFMG